MVCPVALLQRSELGNKEISGRWTGVPPLTSDHGDTMSVGFVSSKIPHKISPYAFSRRGGEVHLTEFVVLVWSSMRI